MARDGSGNYNPPSPENPVVSGTSIDADDHNTTISDISTALTASVAKDGQTVPTANLPMGGFRHTNVGAATTRTQYATVAGIQDDTYNILGSVSGTNTITCSASPAISAYVDKSNWIIVPFANNTGATTLNVNSVAARAVVRQDGTALVAGDLVAGVAAHVIYDLANTRWVLTNPNVFLLNTTSAAAGYQPLDADLTALAALSTTGVVARTAANTYVPRTITGAAGKITVTNGDGVAGAPALDIAATYVGQNTITTLGTITTGTWTGTDVAVADGGTGSSTASGARTNLGLVIGTDVIAPSLSGADFTGLTTIEGNALVAGDDFLVMDDTTAKRIQYSDAGIPVTTVAGTTDTLATADINTMIVYTSATAVAVTLNTGVGKVGNIVVIKQAAAGKVTVSGTATITASAALSTRTTNSVISLICTAADTWTIFGDIG